MCPYVREPWVYVTVFIRPWNLTKNVKKEEKTPSLIKESKRLQHD